MFRFTNKQKTFGGILGVYSIYGGFRFVQEDRFVNQSYYLKNKIFYRDTAFTFIKGCIAYAFPISFVFSLPNELYRLEVNLRGLDDEKKNMRYHRTLLEGI